MTIFYFFVIGGVGRAVDVQVIDGGRLRRRHRLIEGADVVGVRVGIVERRVLLDEPAQIRVGLVAGVTAFRDIRSGRKRRETTLSRTRLLIDIDLTLFDWDGGS
jgi:hypothetical protein